MIDVYQKAYQDFKHYVTHASEAEFIELVRHCPDDVHPAVVLGAALARGKQRVAKRLIKRHPNLRFVGLIGIAATICPDREFAREFARKHKLFIYPIDLVMLGRVVSMFGQYIDWKLFAEITEDSVIARLRTGEGFTPKIRGAQPITFMPWSSEEIIDRQPESTW